MTVVVDPFAEPPIKQEVATGARATSASIGIKVIRADGRVEDHGVVAYYHRNPFKQAVWWLGRFFRRSK